MSNTRKTAAASKSATVRKMLRRASGATLAEITTVTTWQPHSARAFLSGIRKKGEPLQRDRRANDHFSALENAFEYKQRWTDELERRRRLGIEEPDPIPHPEDVIIDMRTGHVRTEGPMDEREKRSWDERIARRDEAQAEVNSFAERYRRSRSDEHRARWLEEWHFEQRIFDIINDSLPPRYKAKLQNRSYHEGASHEGKTLEAFIQDRKRPKGKRKWGDYVEG